MRLREKQGVVALAHAQLQDPLGEIVVERRARDGDKARQGCPVVLEVAKRLAQGAVGLPQTLLKLPIEPRFESGHQRLALRLVIRQARFGTQWRDACLLVVLADLAAHLEHPLACVRKDRCQVAQLAPTLRQAVTPHHHCVIGHRMARQRVRHGQRFGQTQRPFGQQPLAVVARVLAAGIIQNRGVLPHLYHSGRGVQPGALAGGGHALALGCSGQRAVVFEP